MSKNKNSELTEAKAEVNVEAGVIKPETLKRLKKKHKVDFFDSSNDGIKTCNSCYYCCNGDDGKFCLINSNIYLHTLFNDWSAYRCGCTLYEEGRHPTYG